MNNTAIAEVRVEVIEPEAVAPGEQPYVASRETVDGWRNSSLTGNQWRRDSVQAAEYYDGNQFDQQKREHYRRFGRIIKPENCIKRWIGSILGGLEQDRSDGIVTVEDNRFEELAEALSAKLKEAERLSGADRACFDAAKPMFVSGIGWVEVGSPSDPLDYPHHVTSIPWREMYWDMSSLKPDKSDAEWFRRVRYYRRQALMDAFPAWHDTLKSAGTTSDDYLWTEGERYERNENRYRDYSVWSGARQDEADMLALNELRYRVKVDGYCVKLGDGSTIQFDPDNPRHMAAYQQGLVAPQPCKYQRVRQAFWLGPYQLLDRWCPVPQNKVGWVPFEAFTEERTGVPYGYVRDMIPIQDDINLFRERAQFAMESSTIIADHDRVLDLNAAREAVNRRNGVITLDGSKPNGHFEIDRNQTRVAEYTNMYNDSKGSLGYIHGLDEPFVGKAQSSGQSGIAIQQLSQNSSRAIGTSISNFSEGRQTVLSLLLDRLIEEMGDRPQELKYKSNNERKSVAINVPVQLHDGSTIVMSPKQVKKHLVLEETPSTPTYRATQLAFLTDLARSAPPELQMILWPAILESSEVKNRQNYADQIRKLSGQGGPQTPEEQQAAQAQAQNAQEQQQMAMRAAMAKISKDEADAQKTAMQTQQIQSQMQADMQKMMADIQKIAAGIGETQAKTQLTVAQTENTQVDSASRVQDMQHKDAIPPAADAKQQVIYKE